MQSEFWRNSGYVQAVIWYELAVYSSYPVHVQLQNYAEKRWFQHKKEKTKVRLLLILNLHIIAVCFVEFYRKVPWPAIVKNGMLCNFGTLSHPIHCWLHFRGVDRRVGLSPSRSLIRPLDPCLPPPFMKGCTIRPPPLISPEKTPHPSSPPRTSNT